MIVVACPSCRTRYRVPDTAVGKRTTCRKCGQAFRIAPEKPQPKPATPVTPPEPDLGGLNLEALASGEALEPPRIPTATAHPHPSAGPASMAPMAAGPMDAPHAGVADRLVAAGTTYARYLGAVGQSMAFFRHPSSLLTFFILWLILAAREVINTAGAVMPMFMGQFFFAIAWFIISGWYMAFKMSLVIWAAGNEEELPPLAAEEGMWDGVIVPFFRMLATYIFAFLPVGIFVAVLSGRMAAAAVAAGAGGLGPAGTPIPGSATIAVLVILTLIGSFIWPMMVLVVSCGGSFMAMFRLDLILATMFKTLPAYLLTVLAVYITFGGQIVVTMYIWASVGDTTNWTDDWVAIFVLPTTFAGIGLYFDIVAMRAIGYYYYFFKDRFAWSWG